MRRYLLPSLVVLLLSPVVAYSTTYTSPTTGQQSPGYVPESSPGVPYTNTPSKGTGAYSAVTVGASSAQALAAATATVFLDIVNESASATVACAFGATAVINGRVRSRCRRFGTGVGRVHSFRLTR